MQYAVLPTKKDPEIPVSARYESPKPARPLMFGYTLMQASERSEAG